LLRLVDNYQVGNDPEKGVGNAPEKLSPQSGECS
jgi:hypothetical protein